MGPPSGRAVWRRPDSGRRFAAELVGGEGRCRSFPPRCLERTRLTDLPGAQWLQNAQSQLPRRRGVLRRPNAAVNAARDDPATID